MTDFSPTTTDAILAERIRKIETCGTPHTRHAYLLSDLSINMRMVRERAFTIALADQKRDAAFAAKYGYPQTSWAELYDRAYLHELTAAEEQQALATAWRDNGHDPEWRAEIYDLADRVNAHGKYKVRM